MSDEYAVGDEVWVTYWMGHEVIAGKVIDRDGSFYIIQEPTRIVRFMADRLRRRFASPVPVVGSE